MAESPEFKKWHKIECFRKSGEELIVEETVDRQMRQSIRIEGKSNNRWIEIA